MNTLYLSNVKRKCVTDSDFDALFERDDVKQILKAVAIDTRHLAEQRRRDNRVAPEVAAQRVSV